MTGAAPRDAGRLPMTRAAPRDAAVAMTATKCPDMLSKKEGR